MPTMPLSSTRWTIPFTVLLMVGMLALGHAQDDPFAGGDADDAAGAPDAAGGKKKAAAKPYIDTSKAEGIAVQAILDSKPATPKKQIEAAQSLLGLGYPEYAREIIAPLSASPPVGAEASKLVRDFGSSLFLNWLGRPEMAPEGHTLAKTILANAADYIRNPVQIQAAITDLSQPGAKANRARLALREAGLSAMPSLFAALADPSRKAEFPAIRGAILAYREAAIDPLMPLLLSNDARLRAEAAVLLGRLGAESAAPYLAALAVSDTDADVQLDDARTARWALRKLGNDVPSRDAAILYLDEKVTEALDDKGAPKYDYQDTRRIWNWNDAKRELSVREVPIEQDRRETAARLAEALARVQPNDPWHQRRRLLAQLAYEQSVAGDRGALAPATSPGVKLANEMGVDAVDGVLADALKSANVPAILACCRILGASGRPELLTRHQPQPAPLAEAMRFVDRRVRRAATDAALRLNYLDVYPGDSNVIANLEHFIATSGAQRILIGHGNRDEAARLAALWSEMGYTADFATSGKRLFEMAVATPDYQMILVSDTVDRWNVLETVQWLRRDRRTFDIPIGVMKRPQPFATEQPLARRSALEPRRDAAPPPPNNYGGQAGFIRNTAEVQNSPDLKLDVVPVLVPLEQPNRFAEVAAAEVPLAVLVSTPVSHDGADWVTRELQDRAGGRLYPLERIVDDASWAVRWAAKLSDQYPDGDHFDLNCLENALIKALSVPELAIPAAKCLGHLGTPQAQTALIDQASLNGVDLAARQAAATAFAKTIVVHGTLLTKQQLLDQYERYNASANDVPESLTILANVLDAIEANGNKDSLDLSRE
jgi:CheY-like chemotaxis protein